jgi:acetyltransferase-like isoleucine patch superfamily enzyme
MGRRLPGDWYAGEVPDNVLLDEGSTLETSFSLARFASRRRRGLHMAYGSAAYTGTMFDVGPEGSVRVGRYALLNSVRIICDAEIEIGDYALLSWNVLLMDSYREPLAPEGRRRYREQVAAGAPPAPGGPLAPIRIGSNVWIGFDSCILPGVVIGPGSVVGARSVVIDSVPSGTLVAGNPARFIRTLDAEAAGREGAIHAGAS